MAWNHRDLRGAGSFVSRSQKTQMIPTVPSMRTLTTHGVSPTLASSSLKRESERKRSKVGSTFRLSTSDRAAPLPGPTIRTHDLGRRGPCKSGPPRLPGQCAVPPDSLDQQA